LYQALETTRSPLEALLTLNTVVFFHERLDNGFPFDIGQIKMRVTSGETDRRLEYLREPSSPKKGTAVTHMPHSPNAANTRFSTPNTVADAGRLTGLATCGET
jgi:hypothetical protein